MTWTRLPDDFTDGPRMLGVSRSARLLHVEALVYCNRHLTDGLLPRAALPRITDAEATEDLVRELEVTGLWAALDEARWQIDWTDQEQAVDVQARQTAQAEKQRKYRRRKTAHDAGDHSLCSASHCSSVTGNATSNETGGVTPSRPDPSRPKDRGQGNGGRRGQGAADTAEQELTRLRADPKAAGVVDDLSRSFRGRPAQHLAAVLQELADTASGTRP